MRVFDALLAALLAPLAMLLALRLSPQPAVGWGAAVLTAAMPGVDANLTSVTNDVLVSVLGAVTILAAIRGPATLRRALVVGVLFGLAVLAKTTAIALVPALLVALAWRWRRVAAVATAFGAAALVVIPWVIANVLIYGEVVTTREQLAMSAFPERTGALDFWSVSTLHSFVTFWSGDPFLSLFTAVPLVLLAALLCALAIAGLLRAPRTGELLVVALAAVGAGLASVSSPVLAAFNAPGRLAYVGVGAVTALVACGLWTELTSWRLQRAAVALFAAVSVLGLGVLIYPSAPVSGPGEPGADTEMFPTNGTASFNTFSVTVRTCMLDPQHDVWLLVRIQNTGSAPAEWSQTVDVMSEGRTLATSSYRMGTAFPMTLPAGYDELGYLWLGPQSRLPSSGVVRFRDVATDGYHQVGDVVIATPLC